jgi:dihydrofolate reductase
MKVALIVAVDNENGIGKNNDLMWHLPDDMRFFKEKTTGHVVVMGRKNWDSIPAKFRPLPNRENAVLTRNLTFSESGCKVFNSLEECFSEYSTVSDKKVFIIGGGEVYKLALESGYVTEMFITHVHKSFGADTFFPPFSMEDWTIETVLTHDKDEKHEAGFTIKHYTKK